MVKVIEMTSEEIKKRERENQLVIIAQAILASKVPSPSFGICPPGAVFFVGSQPLFAVHYHENRIDAKGPHGFGYAMEVAERYEFAFKEPFTVKKDYIEKKS